MIDIWPLDTLDNVIISR